MVQDWSSSNKKRREQQVRLIKQGGEQVTNYPPRRDTMRNFSFENTHTHPWNEIADKAPRNRFLWQACVSCLFLMGTYFLFQSHSPVTRPAENFVYEVMTREFNFAGCSDLYNRYVGNMPSVLPALSSKVSTTESDLTWKAPVEGKVVLSYDGERRGVVIRTTPSAEAVASADGWVAFAGNKEGFGNTVILRHAGGSETWYGWLDRFDIKEKDRIKQGQYLGAVRLTKGQPLLYFALKKDQQFIDPVGVIRFE